MSVDPVDGDGDVAMEEDVATETKNKATSSGSEINYGFKLEDLPLDSDSDDEFCGSDNKQQVEDL